MLPKFAYVRARTVNEAIEQSQSEGAVIHAGGTDLLGCLRDGVFSADKIVAVGGVNEMRGITRTGDGGLRIGALTTLAELAGHPIVTARYAALAEAAASAASPQLRNQGTIGGNLCQRPRCWYFRGDFDCLRKGGRVCYAIVGENRYHCILGGSGCVFVHPSDTAPALSALGASIRIASPAGPRLLAIDSFFVSPSEDVRRETVLGPGELITEVVLPAPASGRLSTYRKARSRGAWDFALAGVAASVTLSQSRVEHAGIVLSGVAPVPWRAGESEAVLAGNELDAATIARAAEASVSGATPLAQNGYKVDLARAIVEEALQTLAAQHRYGPPRGTNDR